MGEYVIDEAQARRPWTVERAAYWAMALLAAGLRLCQLGLRPLSDGEAAQALAAFRFTHGTGPLAPAGTVPALFSGNVIAFSLLGAGDFIARWLPALAGLILVLLPYGLRHRLGRGGALAASLLLALSPTAVFFSRSLDGAAVVAACGLALAVALIRALDGLQPNALCWAAVALGLGLCAGPAIYSVLLIFLAFGLGLFLSGRLLGRGGGWSALTAAWRALRSEKRPGARPAVTLAATFGLLATCFALYPAGVGHAADLFAAWLKSFLPEPGGLPAIYPVLLLLRYEPLILVLGLVEGIWLLSLAFRLRRLPPPPAAPDSPAPDSRQGGPLAAQSTFSHEALLAFWAAVALVIVLVSGHRPASGLLLVLVPLALLAGQGIERACRWLSRGLYWAEATAVVAFALGIAAFVYLQMASYTIADRAAPVSFGGLAVSSGAAFGIVVAVAFFLLVGLFAVAWFWRGAGAAVAGGWLAVVLALGLFGLKATWGLNMAHVADPRELMVSQATALDVKEFAAQVSKLSVDEAGDAYTLPVTVDASTGPVVAWYLRNFEGQTVVENLRDPPGTLAAVTLARQDLPIGQTYTGRGFPLRRRWSPWGMDWPTFLRWLLFTDGVRPAVDQEVVLWVAAGPPGE